MNERNYNNNRMLNAGGRNLRGMRCFPTAIAFSSAATFPPHYYGIPQGLPFNLYGYAFL